MREREIERESHLATAMDPLVVWELLTHYRRGSKVDEDSLPNGFPSGRVPTEAFRWDRGIIEACGGERIVSGIASEVSGYMGIYSVRTRSEGANGGHKASGSALTPRVRPLPCGSLVERLVFS